MVARSQAVRRRGERQEARPRLGIEAIRLVKVCKVPRRPDIWARTGLLPSAPERAVEGSRQAGITGERGQLRPVGSQAHVKKAGERNGGGGETNPFDGSPACHRKDADLSLMRRIARSG